MRGGPATPFPKTQNAYFESRVCTAQFKMTSLDVKLRIREQRDAESKRKKVLSTTYLFLLPSLSVGSPVALTWDTDSENNPVGNFKLVVEGDGNMFVRFRNEAFSNERVGTFEVESGLDQPVKNEAVISGLAMLAMNQSPHLPGRSCSKDPDLFFLPLFSWFCFLDVPKFGISCSQYTALHNSLSKSTSSLQIYIHPRRLIQ
jgi:hypothetical protein